MSGCWTDSAGAGRVESDHTWGASPGLARESGAKEVTRIPRWTFRLLCGVQAAQETDWREGRCGVEIQGRLLRGTRLLHAKASVRTCTSIRKSIGRRCSWVQHVS
jgi:hypothetical protein